MFLKLRDWIPLERLNWNELSMNPNAIHLLENNVEYIDWKYLSMNPNAIPLLEANPDKINWYWLSLNPNAMHLLENNIECINWSALSDNPAIFTYDYELIRKTNFEKNLCVSQWFSHPRFVEKYIDKYGVEALDEYL